MAFTLQIGVFAVLLCSLVNAQNSTDTLDKNNQLKETVVTGQYGETSLKNSVYKVKLIDQKRIQQQGAVTLKDIMANELNIRISNDPVLGSGMNIQGMSGQNVKIMIDGVPVVGREGGSIDLTQINLNNIERIEMVEGPMSVNYGTDALGGVVNLITKKGTKNIIDAGITSYYESSGKYNTGFTTSMSSGKWNMQINGARNFFDGFSYKETGRFMNWKPYTQYFGDINFGRVTKNSSIRMQNSYFEEKVTDRDSGTITPYYAFGIDHYYFTRRLSSSLFYHKKLNDKYTLDVLGSFNYYRRINNTYSKDLVTLVETIVPATDQQDTTYFYNGMSRGTISANNITKWFAYQAGYEVNYEQNKGSKIQGGVQSIADYNVFGSTELKVANRLMVKPGLRLIYNTKYNAPITPSLNFKWDLRDFLSIRGSYGRGFRAPSLKELYLMFVDPNHNVLGNPNLKAEVSDNLQLATTMEWKASEHIFRVEPSAFYNHLYNKISLLQNQTGGSSNTIFYRYGNIDEYQSKGVNLNTEYRTPRYSYVLGYSYAAINNKLNNHPETNKFYYSNEVRFNFNYSFPKKNLSLGLFYKFNGKQQIPQLDTKSQSVVLGYINPYSLMDITATKQILSKHVSITAGCKNVLNLKNVSANMASGVHSDISTSAMIGMGRLFFCSLVFQLNASKGK